jgi:hypothetical protein
MSCFRANKPTAPTISTTIPKKVQDNTDHSEEQNDPAGTWNFGSPGDPKEADSSSLSEAQQIDNSNPANEGADNSDVEGPGEGSPVVDNADQPPSQKTTTASSCRPVASCPPAASCSRLTPSQRVAIGCVSVAATMALTFWLIQTVKPGSGLGPAALLQMKTYVLRCINGLPDVEDLRFDSAAEDLLKTLRELYGELDTNKVFSGPRWANTVDCPSFDFTGNQNTTLPEVSLGYAAILERFQDVLLKVFAQLNAPAAAALALALQPMHALLLVALFCMFQLGL